MLHRTLCCSLVLFLSGSALVTLTGCASPSTSLPATVVVELPDGTTVEVEAGGGVPSLADSSWDFFRSGAGAAFVRITFGPSGELTSFTNSTIAPEIFGATILFDGVRHATSEPPLEYAATTFGAGTADGTGFAFEAVFVAFALAFEVGDGSATASGTFDPDNGDRMTGTFTFSTQITLDPALLAQFGFPADQTSQTDTFEFVAERVAQ